MFATLNLQIASIGKALDGAIDLGGTAAAGHTTSESGPLPFSALLAMRTDLVTGQPPTSGEWLSADGKGLPHDGNDLPPLELPEIELPSAQPLRSNQPNDLQDRDLDLELEVHYAPPEILLTAAPPVQLLPVERVPALVVGLPEPGPKLATPATTDGELNAQPLPAIDARQVLRDESRLQVATTLATSIPGATELGSEASVLQPLAESLLRDKVQPAAPQTIKPPVLADDGGTIKLADAPERVLVPTIGRTMAALEAVQRPDTRVAATSSAHSTTPLHLPTTISQFNNDLTLSRSDILTDTINTPVRDPAWGDKLGERVLMLSGNQIKTAEIKLTPADLGPLSVRVRVEDGAAHVSFHAQHAVTREALEQAMPRLREMLAESGLSLGQTDVSEQGVADGKADREFASSGNTGSATEQHDDTADSERVERRKTVTRNNLLDTFA